MEGKIMVILRTTNPEKIKESIEFQDSDNKNLSLKILVTPKLK